MWSEPSKREVALKALPATAAALRFRWSRRGTDARCGLASGVAGAMLSQCGV